MRIVTAAVLGLTLFLAGAAPAQIIIFESKKSAPTRTLGEYKKELSKHERMSRFLTNEKFYADHEFKNTKTKASKTFSQLSPFEKQLFYLSQAEYVSKLLENLESKWRSEADGMKDEEESVDEKDDAKASKSAAKLYANLLHQVRKDHAQRWEAYAQKFFEANGDKFSEVEARFYMSQLRKQHDEKKLVERKDH